MVDSVMEAQTNLSEAGIDVEIEEAVADKGYHATDTLELADSLNIRTLHPGAEAERKAQLAGRAGGETSGGAQQSASHPRRTEQAAATPAKRTGGTELRPCVRHGRCPAELAVWDREGSKALPDCRGGPQPGLDHAQAVRNRDAEGLAGRGRPCFFCLSCLASRSSRCAALVPRYDLPRGCFTFLRHCTLIKDNFGDFGLLQRAVRNAKAREIIKACLMKHEHQHRSQIICNDTDCRNTDYPRHLPMYEHGYNECEAYAVGEECLQVALDTNQCQGDPECKREVSLAYDGQYANRVQACKSFYDPKQGGYVRPL